MQTLQNGLSGGMRSLAVMLEVGLDRVLIPLAIVVALAGSAMIGGEIARMFPPDHHQIR
ncbi:hypothetical protein LV82_02387 [Albidovulum inexpectatum]|uniref:Uncharacterized protein n=1 Tax=Albidovulum inexpectatum TaxID=196587 RepID=A0A2S5JF26_9RHOB|nr:hypothetical protein [Albidovulum inexpectatum]PPB80102.1 hypothetical protein LV82_02387 [Albidovulum inexpectatum]